MGCAVNVKFHPSGIGENPEARAKWVSLIKTYYGKGARYITLCHTRNNDICDSSTDTTEFNGLSEFGRNVVKFMNQTGMMVDISHVSDKSFYDVIALSKAPVIASHSCARAICDKVSDTIGGIVTGG